MNPDIDVEIFQTSDPTKVTLGTHPVIIRGLSIGPCVYLWNNIDYLKSRISDEKRVTVHVCQQGEMNFIKKNFLYKTIPFSTFLDRASSKGKLDDFFLSPNEKYYLRALGDDPRKEPALFGKHFTELAPDVHVPNIFFKERLFSSVLRGSSAGVRLWTHYDIMDNILLQVVGRKTVVLFDPDDAPFLYLDGDKSEVINVENPDYSRYPLFANAKRYRAQLVPGDILYIPALWFHNVVAEDFSLAVNAFWRSTSVRDDFYDTKDVYGNSDLIPAQRAFQGVEKAMKQLDELPERYRQFYAYRCVKLITKKFHLSRDAFTTTSDTSADTPVLGSYFSSLKPPFAAAQKEEAFCVVRNQSSDAIIPNRSADTLGQQTVRSDFLRPQFLPQVQSPFIPPSTWPSTTADTFQFEPSQSFHSAGGSSGSSFHTAPPIFMQSPMFSVPSFNDNNVMRESYIPGGLATQSDKVLLQPPIQKPRREKKVLEFINPDTGEKLLTNGKNEKERSNETTAGAIWNSPDIQQIRFGPLVVGDIMEPSAIDSWFAKIKPTGEGLQVYLPNSSAIETAPPTVVEGVHTLKQPNGHCRYNREFMMMVAQLPCSKLKPVIKTSSWSKDYRDEVLNLGRMPPFKTGRNHGRMPRGAAKIGKSASQGQSADLGSVGDGGKSELFSAGRGKQRPPGGTRRLSLDSGLKAGSLDEIGPKPGRKKPKASFDSVASETTSSQRRRARRRGKKPLVTGDMPPRFRGTGVAGDGSEVDAKIEVQKETKMKQPPSSDYLRMRTNELSDKTGKQDADGACYSGDRFTFTSDL